MEGQRNSSTRMELAGTIAAMTRATAWRIASDSKSMIDKAMKLKEVATQRISDPESVWWPEKNLAGKPWALQNDADLWKLLWAWQKVKGHATEEHIRNGIATEETKRGNDSADLYAPRGILEHQEQAVNLAKWLKDRQERYAKLVARIKIMFVAVPKKEKEERAKSKAEQSFAMGYDRSKHEYVTRRLPEVEQQAEQLVKLDLVPPVKGTHSYMKQQRLMNVYTDFWGKANGPSCKAMMSIVAAHV